MQQLKTIEESNGQDYIRRTLNYVISSGEMSSEKDFVEVVEQGLETIKKGEFMGLMDRRCAESMEKDIEKGMQAGKQLGLQEGTQVGVRLGSLKARQIIARKLLGMGLANTEISNITELSIQEKS